MAKRIAQLTHDLKVVTDAVTGKKSLVEIYDRWNIRHDTPLELLLGKLQELKTEYDRWNEEMPVNEPIPPATGSRVG